MTCDSCGYEIDPIPMPSDYEMEMGQFFFDAILAAGKGHHIGSKDPHNEWHKISEDTRRCFGHAAAAFYRRFVCAG